MSGGARPTFISINSRYPQDNFPISNQDEAGKKHGIDPLFHAPAISVLLYDVANIATPANGGTAFLPFNLQENYLIRSLWISKTGLDAQQTQMDVIANNLANVSTNGFKRSRAVFEDLMYQTLRQPGAQSSQQTQLPSGLQIGTGVRPVATERVFTQGNLQQTGNWKDVAINGQGFFQVLRPDGSTAYTRDGSFQIDAEGQLVTLRALPLGATALSP